MEQKLWFRAKTYGWGWYPTSWKGWASVAAYVTAMTLIAVRAGEELRAFDIELAKLVVAYALLTSALIITCYAHGEKPTWRWGNKK